MPVVAKLGGFVAVLAAVFGVAFLTGTQSSALLAPPAAHAAALGGLTASAEGYTLAVERARVDPGAGQRVGLTLTGPDGGPVGKLIPVDGAVAHLVALRRDLAGFQHVTPSQGGGTTWAATLDLTPGPWRVMLEVQPRGLPEPVTLGVDLTVRGDYVPGPPPPTTDTVTVDDLVIRRLVGPSTRLDASMVVRVQTTAGQRVTDLQPLQGAPAHAVAIRPSDLGLAHLHAEVGAAGGPRVEFAGGVPDPGAYAVFVELRRADRLHVAAYTVDVR